MNLTQIARKTLEAYFERKDFQPDEKTKKNYYFIEMEEW